jgi:hypothetical protein
MQLICSRTIPYLDPESLAAGEGREALFRREDGRFILYLADGAPSSASEERVIPLALREALIWLNEPARERGLFCV